MALLTSRENSCQDRYTPAVMIRSHRAAFAALAVLVAVFVALYPYLDCGPGGCPDAAQAPHPASGGSLVSCLVAVLVAAPAARGFAGGHAFRRPSSDLRSSQTYLSPEPHPPQTFPDR